MNKAHAALLDQLVDIVKLSVQAGVENVQPSNEARELELLRRIDSLVVERDAARAELAALKNT